MMARLGWSSRKAPQSQEADLAALLERLEEPTAICDLHGVVRLSNQAWRAILGPGAAGGFTDGGLFTTFKLARRDGRAKASLRLGGAPHIVTVASLNDERFLVRLAPEPAAPAPKPPAWGPSTLSAASVFAEAPFGAALIQGEDPFTAPIIEANRALPAVVGRPVPPGTPLADLLDAGSCLSAAAAHAAGAPGPHEVALAALAGRTAHLYLAPAGSRTAVYLLDVTEQKSLQLQLSQRNKMEAIGQLAGGMAHDFNNHLSAIRLSTDELLLSHPLGDPAFDNLNDIRETVLKSANLVSHLLTFSRKATVFREALDLGEVLMGGDVLLRRLLRDDIRLETDYGGGLPLVKADRTQIETAVMNLVVNARDAIAAERGRGTIRLRTLKVAGADAAALGYGGAPATELAMIEVADDGPGIAPEVIGNIFEPFFTTKGQGEGTGLGLATVYGIVKQSEGWISATTPPEGGATFRIFLPAYDPPLSLEPPPAAPQPSRARDLSGVGRILFVEDEPLVRNIAARLLRTRGYEVIEAGDGDEAFELAKEHAGKIDLMISDVMMPGMDGPALLKAARPYLGGAPVMFISGYAESEFSDLLEGETGVTFLPKPLDIQSLAERVKQRLSGG
jgi:two-component system cell cycle sensor histidine kinase/response regulator CckA